MRGRIMARQALSSALAGMALDGAGGRCEGLLVEVRVCVSVNILQSAKRRYPKGDVWRKMPKRTRYGAWRIG